MNIEARVRHLARTAYWQRIFRYSKELSNIGLFDNINNFSGIQVHFLYWLEIYSVVYKELAQREWDILDEEVIEDDIRLDAFLYWRNQEQYKELAKHKQEIKTSKLKHKDNSSHRSLSIYSGGVKGK